MINLLEKLDARIRRLNQSLSTNMAGRPYNFAYAEERELLEAAAKRISELERQVWITQMRVNKLSAPDGMDPR